MLTEEKIKEVFKSVLDPALVEERAEIVKEATAKVLAEMQKNGMDFNAKADFPKHCKFNTDKATRKNAYFSEISQEANDFAEDFKSIVRSVKAGGSFDASKLLRAKAFNETDDDDGGYFVPDEVGAGIIRYMSEGSVVRGRATIKTTSGNKKGFNKLNQTSDQFAGVTLYVIKETGTMTESTAKIGRIVMQLAKIAGLTTITDELLQDNNVGLVNFITTLFGDAIAYFEDNLFFNGTGTGEPMGILNSALCQSVARETAGAVSITDLLGMDNLIPDQLESGLVWVMRKVTYNSLVGKRASVYNGSALVESGDFLITKDITGKGPGNMLGYPIIKSDKVAALGSEGDVLLANFKGYGILDKQGGGISVATSIHTLFTTDQTQMRFIKRVDGQPISDKAFVKLGDTA